MINLFINYYEEKNSERQEELNFCLQKNIECKKIEKIFLINESLNELPLKYSKIVDIRIGNRPKFTDFINIINKITSQSNINIIANSDIYFDQSLEHIKYFKMEDRVLALSRWDIKYDGSVELFNRSYSQDSWIFKGMLKPFYGDFEVGMLASDNRLIYELKRVGYKISNPSISIKTYHYHISAYRPNHDLKNRIPPPYAWVVPSAIYPQYKNPLIYFYDKQLFYLNNKWNLYREARHNHFAFLIRHNKEINNNNILIWLKNIILKYCYYNYYGKMKKILTY